MSKRLVIAASLVAAVIVILAGYFTILPIIQIHNFKKAAQAKHQQVDAKLRRVYDSFKRDVFTAPDVASSTAKSDLQASRNAVKDALTTIESSSLPKFSSCPLLEWNAQYKLAASTSAEEANYLAQARTFLTDYTVLLDYTAKATDIRTQAETAIISTSKIGDQATLASLTATLDAGVAAYKAALSQEKALVPPSYLKASQDKSLATNNQILASLADLSAGARALDVAKVGAASAAFDKLIADTTQEDKALINTLQHGSPIEHEISALQAANHHLVGNYASL